MTWIFRRSRTAADAARSIRDASLGAWHRAVSGALTRLPHPSAENGSNVRRILVIKLDKLGDVILVSPFFRELRRNYPDARITAVVSREANELMRCCPYVNRTLPVDPSPVDILAARRIARAIRKDFGTPDLTIVPRYCVDLYGAGWIAFFSGAPKRLTFSEFGTPRKSKVNRGADALFTDVIHSNAARHEVERSLDLLRNLGLNVMDDRLEVWPSEPERREAASMLGSANNDAAPLVALGLGASQAKKMWPVERFADVCRRLHAANGARIVAMGTRAEAHLLNQLRERLGQAVAVSGTVGLGTLAALFERCSLFLGTDSAQKHIAAAAGVPVVEVSCHPAHGDTGGGNNTVRFHAWGVAQVVLQPNAASSPCRVTCEALAPHCILDVSVEDVARAAAELLAARRPAISPAVLK